MATSLASIVVGSSSPYPTVVSVDIAQFLTGLGELKRRRGSQDDQGGERGRVLHAPQRERPPKDRSQPQQPHKPQQPRRPQALKQRRQERRREHHDRHAHEVVAQIRTALAHDGEHRHQLTQEGEPDQPVQRRR
jgi:hypothetical protein